MVTLTVDRIFGASLSPLPSTNENINYDSLAKSPTSQLQEIAWIGKTNRGPDFESQA